MPPSEVVVNRASRDAWLAFAWPDRYEAQFITRVATSRSAGAARKGLLQNDPEWNCCGTAILAAVRRRKRHLGGPRVVLAEEAGMREVGFCKGHHRDALRIDYAFASALRFARF
ncbi:MAG: hypothetical protein N2512_14805 [Armatimonadetes bacterium]|nr:hypothetical protein [Armatimonadota bacterium]